MNSAIKIKKAANLNDSFKDLVITNSRRLSTTSGQHETQTTSAISSVPVPLRRSYLNQYKIFLGPNHRIKQVKVTTRCAKCASSALRPFLPCKCSQLKVERPKTVGLLMPIKDDLHNEIKSIDRNHLVTSRSDDNQEVTSMSNTDLNRNMLNLIVQNRLDKNMTLKEVDKLITSNKIVTENWSSPFDSINNSACSSHNFEPRTSRPSSRRLSSSMREYDFLEKRRLTNTSSQMSMKTALEKSTEYSFANLRDLEVKHYLKNERVNLSRCQVPETSCESYHKFDVAQRYKTAQLELSPEIDSLVKSSMLIVERIQLERIKSSNPRNRFVSMRRSKQSNSKQ